MSSILSISNTYNKEQKRKNRWVLTFDEIPLGSILDTTGDAGGTIGGTTYNAQTGSDIDVDLNDVDKLELSLFSAQRPNFTIGEVEHHRLNEKAFFPAGKAEFQPLEVVFYDTIELNAGKIMYKWMKAVYNPTTGAVGYKSALKAQGMLLMLDPLGKTVEQWQLENMWPKDINFGDLSYDSTDAAQVTVSFRYDKARIIRVSDGLADNAWGGLSEGSFIPLSPGNV